MFANRRALPVSIVVSCFNNDEDGVCNGTLELRDNEYQYVREFTQRRLRRRRRRRNAQKSGPAVTAAAAVEFQCNVMECEQNRFTDIHFSLTGQLGPCGANDIGRPTSSFFH
jgi:hypothetical protein